MLESDLAKLEADNKKLVEHAKAFIGGVKDLEEMGINNE